MSMLAKAAAGGAGAQKIYVDDVFSAYRYTGNGVTQVINSDVNLSGKGGLFWAKPLNSSGVGYGHCLFDTIRGNRSILNSSSAGLADTFGADAVNFTSTGITLGPDGSNYGYNRSGESTIGWFFSIAPKFFDVQKKNHTGSTATTVDLSALGVVGMVVVKRYSSSGDNWILYHRSFQNGTIQYLDGAGLPFSNASISLTGTTLTLNAALGAGSYIIYAWAHDSSSSGLIQCGTYEGTGSADNVISDIGWEPQYLMIRPKSGLGDGFLIFDTARVLLGGTGYASYIRPNNDGVEAQGQPLKITGSGFELSGNSDSLNNSSSSYVYVAIRRQNKPPTSGAQVYSAVAYTGTDSNNQLSTGFGPDLAMFKTRGATATRGVYDRLRGRARSLYWDSSAAEANNTSSTADLMSFDMNGVTVGSGSVTGINNNPQAYIGHFFRRAPGVFDVVCYKGTGAPYMVGHNLGAVPELAIVKKRTAPGYGQDWYLQAKPFTAGEFFLLNTTGAKQIGSSKLTGLTATTFTPNNEVVQNTDTYVAYIFATYPGISKVGSYTGNGSSQIINCGFAAGARFILVKRTDATGDWYVWDSVRGIVAANDPHLSLNSTAAEVTTDDSVDPDASGFIVNQVAATSINVSGGAYIYLAIA
jgi:hypothetical protein